MQSEVFWLIAALLRIMHVPLPCHGPRNPAGRSELSLTVQCSPWGSVVVKVSTKAITLDL